MIWCGTTLSIAFWSLSLIAESSKDMVYDLTSSKTVLVNDDHVETALGKIVNNHDLQPKNNTFKVLGLISSSTGFGSALISINGEPANAFRTGQVVLDDWILYFASPQGIKLQNRNSFDVLDIPAPIINP